jgi:hypothetical protein
LKIGDKNKSQDELNSGKDEVLRLAERRKMWDKYQLTTIDSIHHFKKNLLSTYLIPGQTLEPRTNPTS